MNINKLVYTIISTLLFFSSIKPIVAQMSPETSDATTHHTITLNNKVYPYTTRVGTITLTDKNGQPTVKMFYTANTVDNISAAKRPITFLYNGGPGVASMMLRIGSFGPKRIKLNGVNAVPPPPYQLIDNENSLLDKTDLVFIDMPGTGFGRIAPGIKTTEFYNVDNDAQAFATFIERYISLNNRWNSPKFLFGESYGCIRTSILANLLQKEAGIHLNGIVLLSSKLNKNLMSTGLGAGDWGYVLYLPTLAATSWYFHTSSYRPNNLSDLINEVSHFSMTEYLEALAEGSTISPKKFKIIQEKLHRYLGISSQYIRNSNLRISPSDFQKDLLRNEGKIIGRFDTRFTSYLAENAETVGDDPVNTAIKPAFITVNNYYLYNYLHYNPSLVYKKKVIAPKDWNFRHNNQTKVNAAEDLAHALTQNPNLRVFSASGYYDLATPFAGTFYVLNHLSLNPVIQSHIQFHFYESGHMVYLDTNALKKFKDDLAVWYDETLKRK